MNQTTGADQRPLFLATPNASENQVEEAKQEGQQIMPANVNLPPPIQRRNNQNNQVMRGDFIQERPVQSQAETTQRGNDPRQRGSNDEVLQRQSGGNNAAANQFSGRIIVQSQNTVENRRTGDQGVQQTANRRNNSTVNNEGRDPRIANLVRPIATEASNNPTFFGVQQTANRRNNSTVNNEGRDPRIANLVRPIATGASNNPTFFSGYGRHPIQGRPVNRGSRPQGSGNTHIVQQQGVYAPAGNRAGGYGTTQNNSGQ